MTFVLQLANANNREPMPALLPYIRDFAYRILRRKGGESRSPRILGSPPSRLES